MNVVEPAADPPSVGRPPKGDEKLLPVSSALTQDRIDAADSAAAGTENLLRRGEILRIAIELGMEHPEFKRRIKERARARKVSRGDRAPKASKRTRMVSLADVEAVVERALAERGAGKTRLMPLAA